MTRYPLDVDSDGLPKYMIYGWNVPDNESLEYYVKLLLKALDITDETDSGREFHPITIGSCRALTTEPLNKTLAKIRELCR